MRFKLSDPSQWRRKFALRPRIIGDEIVWLEHYEYRMSDRQAFQAIWVDRRLNENAPMSTELRMLGWT